MSTIRPRDDRHRSGFTLVELLVVIAIIAILIALILPAVQQAREAARQSACKNNLKQLSLALHNYETNHRAFPPGYQYTSGADFGTVPGEDPTANHQGFAWGALILPQLEQANLHDSIVFDVPVFDPSNQSPRETSLTVFLCPSDTYSEGSFVVRDDTTTPVEQYAGASYCANWGPATASVNLDATPDESKGVFYRNSRTRVRDIRDGLSSTIAIGERTNGPILGGAPPHPNFETTWFAATRDVDVPDDDHGHMVLFDGQFTPNQAVGVGADRGVSAPHSGVALFSYCDGSVHGISEDIAADVYEALCSRAGGEIISP